MSSTVNLLNRIAIRVSSFVWLISALLLSTATLAQQAIPNGTIIPVQLNSTLNLAKTKAGRVFTARVMQDVPGTMIHAGNKIIGHVVSAGVVKDASGAQLTLRFDAVAVSKQRIPISADLRALASMMEVAYSQVPISGPDRGTSQAAWTTNQIGGEVVYRGGGPVANGLRSVGVPAANGVLVRPSSPRGTECHDLYDNDRLQAFWVFSSDACGTYGYPDLEITHSGRSNPVGEIVLTSRKRNMHLQAGSGLLLRVNNAGQSQ